MVCRAFRINKPNTIANVPVGFTTTAPADLRFLQMNNSYVLEIICMTSAGYMGSCGLLLILPRCAIIHEVVLVFTLSSDGCKLISVPKLDRIMASTMPLVSWQVHDRQVGQSLVMLLIHWCYWFTAALGLIYPNFFAVFHVGPPLASISCSIYMYICLWVAMVTIHPALWLCQ